MEKNNDIMGVVSQQKNYKIEVKYSPEAEKKKLIRFTMKGNHKSFEISADELIKLLVTQVNDDLIAPTFVETKRVNVVQVGRQFSAVLEKNMKKGEVIRINYAHPYPLEFALIEEAMKIAVVTPGIERTVLTKEFIDEVKAKLQPRMKEFTENFYQSFKQIGKKEESPLVPKKLESKK